ncbi:hypothetical protein QEH52_12035 [Coraliomargarita sp. SDUM461003]|uniref:LPXTG cell wall anchor domain-containing protein n=1 Tax=Thalassobacterium maritimum TaxID=3041265 RepID=A0ABU1AVR2_9BACT|nr:hypothetical protein [Coraliomargarita sp. SDUM461003]MDQ8208243.1 hypothetical protein [Coraliomargarita sp. SDUM461003]
MKIRFIVIFLLILSCRVLLAEEDIVLDFRESHDVAVLARGSVVSPASGSLGRIGVPAGTYNILLPGGNQFVIDSVAGYINPEFKNDSRISKLSLKTRALTMPEAMALAEAFHDAFDLPKDELYKWVEPFNKGGVFSGFYNEGSLENYPGMSISLLSAYSRETPILIIFAYEWEPVIMKGRGVSPEKNTVKELSFDMPAIIASVQKTQEHMNVEIPATPPALEVVKVVEGVTLHGVVSGGSTEVGTFEPSEEPEQSSQWWLWLVGALVVLGGLVVVVRRKN